VFLLPLLLPLPLLPLLPLLLPLPPPPLPLPLLLLIRLFHVGRILMSTVIDVQKELLGEVDCTRNKPLEERPHTDPSPNNLSYCPFLCHVPPRKFPWL